MMNSVDDAASMDTAQEVSISHDDNLKRQQFYQVVKLIFLGLLLPAVDIGTDVYAIYQYWTFNQRILNYLAMGLFFLIFCHNFVSAWYGWRNWCEPRARNFGVFLCLIFGFGNIRVTIEIIAGLLFGGDVEAR